MVDHSDTLTKSNTVLFVVAIFSRFSIIPDRTLCVPSPPELGLEILFSIPVTRKGYTDVGSTFFRS